MAAGSFAPCSAALGPKQLPGSAPSPCPLGMKDAFRCFQMLSDAFRCSKWVSWESTDFPQLGDVSLTFLRPQALVELSLLPAPHALYLALRAIPLSVPARAAHHHHTSTFLIKTLCFFSPGSGLPSPSQQWLRNVRQECCPLQAAGEGEGSYHLKTTPLCLQAAAVTQGQAAASPGTRTAEFSIFQNLLPSRHLLAKPRLGASRKSTPKLLRERVAHLSVGIPSSDHLWRAAGGL